MKVVLFCGGRGLRIRGYSGRVPKPMIHIGYRPVLWHVMKYYAHFGHTDFILCLGHHGEVIRKYFHDHKEYLSHDFVPSAEDQQPLKPLATGAEDWSLTLVDTGKEACVGERLQAVQPHLEGESVFLANYADGVTDLDLSAMIDDVRRRDATAGFLSVEPFHSFHAVEASRDGTVQNIKQAAETGLRINGGYFVLTQEIFDYMEPGDELVEEPFQRLIREQELMAYEHDGFWGCMDTIKDKKRLGSMHQCGEAPWEVWKTTDRTPEVTPQHNGSRLTPESDCDQDQETLNGRWGESEILEADD